MDFNIPQIGMTRQVLQNQGIFDLKKIALEYFNQQTKQSLLSIWAHDRFLKNGSDGNAEVVTPDNLDAKQCSVWSINHYLGLNRHPLVIERVKEAVEKYGTGCGTSAMSGGHCELHKKLQIKFANIFEQEDAILFPTGYTANVGAISTLCKSQQTLILIDRDSHASIIDGCKLSGAPYLPFKHNSITDLKNKLNKYRKKYVNIVVIVESAYSMEGDIAPLKEIVELKKEFDFLLYVDESHTFGFYGKNGSGLCNELGINKEVDVIMTTLSKSTASIGGIIATSKELCCLLRWATTYMFQASIPPADVAAVDACLEILEKEPNIINELWDKTIFFRNKLIEMGLDVGKSKSPIIPVYIRDSKILKEMEKELFNEGVFTIAIQYPVVKASEVRFRFIVNNSHSFKDIEHVVDVLHKLGKKHKLI